VTSDGSAEFHSAESTSTSPHTSATDGSWRRGGRDGGGSGGGGDERSLALLAPAAVIVVTLRSCQDLLCSDDAAPFVEVVLFRPSVPGSDDGEVVATARSVPAMEHGPNAQWNTSEPCQIVLPVVGAS
jgi:hypothetical protein